MRDMSIDTVNDMLYAMTADVSFFSFLDNTVSGKKHERSFVLRT